MGSRVSLLFSPCTVTLCSLPHLFMSTLSPRPPRNPRPAASRNPLDESRSCPCSRSKVHLDHPTGRPPLRPLCPPSPTPMALVVVLRGSRFVVLRGSSRSSKVGRGHGCTEEQRERTEVRRQQRSQLVRQQPKAAIEAIGEEVGSPRCAPGPSKRKCRNKSDSGHGIGGSRLSHGLGTAEQDRGRSASVRTVDVDQEAKLRLAVF